MSNAENELLDNYDPVPGLVARGIVSDEHEPDSCDADCCVIPPGVPDARCYDPRCRIAEHDHSIDGTTPEEAAHRRAIGRSYADEIVSQDTLSGSLDIETAKSLIASLRARLDAVSDLADHLVGNEAAPLIREALNGYIPSQPCPTRGE